MCWKTKVHFVKWAAEISPNEVFLCAVLPGCLHQRLIKHSCPVRVAYRIHDCARVENTHQPLHQALQMISWTRTFFFTQAYN